MFDFFTKTAEKTAKTETPKINVNFSQTSDKSISDRPEVNVFFPKSFDDVKEIIDVLLAGKQTVVNLRDLSDETAQRVIDIICGAIYALKGGLCEIEKNIFVITPDGIAVK